VPVCVRVRVSVGVRLCVGESDWLSVCDCDDELDWVPVDDDVDVGLGENVDVRDCVGVLESVPLGSCKIASDNSRDDSDAKGAGSTHHTNTHSDSHTCVPVSVGVRESVGVTDAVAL
jgi:hypothetical protein